ncbi:MAG: SDR family oxidoreductase [SAR202 cluster bacterium]|nr:SDR family oxidoreductase [SAR202 cluster bacterium]
MPILPEFNLAGRRALLYTAGGDEAPILAQALAEAGASVVVVSRKSPLAPPSTSSGRGLYERGEGNGLSVGADLRVGPGQTHRPAPTGVTSMVADVTTPQGVSQVMAALESGGHWPVDILVNDARSFFAKPASQISLAEWEAVQARNSRAVFLLCQALGAVMVRRGYGRIVNISSGLAERGLINGAAYCASQASVLALTRALALEWGPHNVRINALGTGWSSPQDTPPEVQQQEQLVRYIPLRRRGRPRDIAPLLVYLCSEVCDYVTGQPVYVDGGLNGRA